MLGNQRIQREHRQPLFWALSLAFILVAALMPRPSASAESVVHDLRVGDHGSKTRVVLELGDRVAFKAYALADPYRVVVDLPEVGWTLPSRPPPTDIGLMSKLRYGLLRPGQSRLVLDLKAPAKIESAFLIEPQAGQPFRLVIDVVRSTREAVIAAAPAAPDAAGDLPATNAPGGNGQAKKSQATASPAPAPFAVLPVPAAGGAVPKPPSPVVAVAVPAVAAPAVTTQAAETAAAPFALPPPKPSAPNRPWVIAIDAGHGGIDPGASGTSGTYEKYVTLAMARELAEVLEKNNRYKAVLVRDRDVFIRLRDRIAIARAAGADLLVSLHADAIDDARVRGLSVYTLSENASDKEAEMLADRENKADLIAGVDLSDKTPEISNILISLAQRETMNQSARFAGRLIKNLNDDTKLLHNSQRSAGFAVLKAADMPSVLVELGFMSNSQDETALKTKTYRTQLARSIVQSIDDYFLGTEQARLR